MISQNNQMKMDKKQERINLVKVEKLINENEGCTLVSSGRDSMSPICA